VVVYSRQTSRGCAALLTRCSTPLPTVSARCFSPRPLQQGSESRSDPSGTSGLLVTPNIDVYVDIEDYNIEVFFDIEYNSFYINVTIFDIVVTKKKR
jgi:hypothetical protein